MLSKVFLAAQLTALPLTVSDLLVGLESDDTKEVIHQAHILKKQATVCEALLLQNTAQKIGQTATVSGLAAVRVLVPQLQQHLQQALQAMQQIA
jgi:HPt (histidine-containing phosphotransfer) domain-containing protein